MDIRDLRYYETESRIQSLTTVPEWARREGLEMSRPQSSLWGLAEAECGREVQPRSLTRTLKEWLQKAAFSSPVRAGERRTA